MKLLFVIIDGLRPDGLVQSESPAIKKIQTEGAYSFEAVSVMPSLSLPCHMSIFHSVPPDRHGITTNDWTPMARPVPGLFEVAKQHDLICGFFYNWENLRDLSRPGNLEISYFINSTSQFPPDPAGDQILVDAVVQHLNNSNLDICVVYLGTLDIFGHYYGWMSDPYLDCIFEVDQAVGKLCQNLPDETTIILSDHGGHDRIHGTDLAEDMTIPWIIKGPNIKTNYKIQQSVSLLDTAPTIAHLTGISIPDSWEGSIVAEILIENEGRSIS